jgi:hypothetical protein
VLRAFVGFALRSVGQSATGGVLSLATRNSNSSSATQNAFKIGPPKTLLSDCEMVLAERAVTRR